MDFDPYSLDPILTEDYQWLCDITFPTPTVRVTETNDFEWQHLSPDQWCSCCCCESRPTHIECICCREMKTHFLKLRKDFVLPWRTTLIHCSSRHVCCDTLFIASARQEATVSEMQNGRTGKRFSKLRILVDFSLSLFFHTLAQTCVGNTIFNQPHEGKRRKYLQYRGTTPDLCLLNRRHPRFTICPHYSPGLSRQQTEGLNNDPNKHIWV